jgi:hypothetical protein
MTTSRGPDAYENWRAAASGKAKMAAFEYALYSDARLTGEVTTGLGPYRFFNPVALRCERGFVRVASVLQLDLHIDFNENIPAMGATDVGSYHGGTMVDELAALASLLTGARFRAGGESRRFDVGGDPAGRPVAWDAREAPTLGIDPYGIVLPGAEREHSLMPLERLSSLIKLAPEDAIALVRSARLYQDALWVAETEPNLAWIMLVSAVEGAANRWRAGKDAPLLRLEGARPELGEYLTDTGITGLVERIAAEFADALGSTAKFVGFLAEHLAPPPATRPEEWGQVKWETASLRPTFRSIYNHRSRALHDGIPFPAPLCRPVVNPANRSVPSERPIELAASERGGVWVAKDLPMYLHTFEYIARTAMVTWWQRAAA